MARILHTATCNECTYSLIHAEDEGRMAWIHEIGSTVDYPIRGVLGKKTTAVPREGSIRDVAAAPTTTQLPSQPMLNGTEPTMDELCCKQAYQFIVLAKQNMYKAKKELDGMVLAEQRELLLQAVQTVYDSMDVVVERIRRKVQVT